MKSHNITGGGGIQLHLVETGNSRGRPIIFIHGFSQCWLAWSRQIGTAGTDYALAVAADATGNSYITGFSSSSLGGTSEVDPHDILTPWQYDKMATRPHLIQQFARYLATRLEAQGHVGVEIRAQACVSLNGRRPQHLIDPTADLARQPLSAHAPWIRDLNEPLAERGERVDDHSLREGRC